MKKCLIKAQIYETLFYPSQIVKFGTNVRTLPSGPVDLKVQVRPRHNEHVSGVL